MSRRNAFAGATALTPLGAAAAGRAPKASGFSIRKLPHPTEHQQQCAVIQWAELSTARWPELSLLHAIPNAGAGAQRGQAGKLKAEGVKPGVPDLFLPIRRKHASGIYVEMKRIGENPTVEQRAWQTALQEQGFEAHVAHGAERAIALLERYLKRPK